MIRTSLGIVGFMHVGGGDAEHDVVCWAVAESAAAREAAS